MDKFKNKVWYRAVKVIYFIVFIFVLIFTIKIVYDKNPIAYINKNSCIDGSILIRKTNDLSYESFLREKECFGIKEFSKYESLLPVERNKESSNLDVSLFVKTGIYLLLNIFTILIIFWLIKRIFFYIFSGEKIFKIK